MNPTTGGQRKPKNPFEESISFDNDTNFQLHGSGYALTFLFGLNCDVDINNDASPVLSSGQALIMGAGAALLLGRSVAAETRRRQQEKEREEREEEERRAGRTMMMTLMTV